MPSRYHLVSTLAVCALFLPTIAISDDFFFGESMPEVLTATRLKQSPAAVPGSVTVLDRELITASGARDIPELMRLVPGMMVGYTNGHTSTINYHGGRVSEARRLQVLIDGRSVYRPGLATVDWNDLPIALEDIERIEVFRGPNTVSYGANALMGVISIITRKPADSLGTTLKYTRGERGIDDRYLAHGFSTESTDLRLSISTQSDNGFDKTDLGTKYRDGRRSTRALLSATQTLDFQQTIDWQLAFKEGSKQLGFYNNDLALVPRAVKTTDHDKDVTTKDFAGSVRWSFDSSPAHSLQVQSNLQRWERQQRWNSCDFALAFTPEIKQLFTANPDKFDTLMNLFKRSTAWQVTDPKPDSEVRPVWEQYFGINDLFPLANAIVQNYQDLSGMYTQPICGDVNNDIIETRFDLELQDTWSVTDDLRLLSGLSYRYEHSDSETYFNGSLSNTIWRAFTHAEWYAGQRWVLQGGAMYEIDQRSGNSLTPRLALNYLITPRHGLRFVYSEAVRSPDLFENEANWNYRIRNLSSPLNGATETYYFAHARGPGNLKQEITRSREIGYNGLFDFGLSVDIKYFDDDVRQMISEPLDITDFAPTNQHSMWIRGVEGEINWQIFDHDRLRLSYAYIGDFKATEKTHGRLTARYSGSAGWMRSWGHGLYSSIFYYGADRLNERRFERVDVRLAKRWRIGKTELELAGTLQQRLDKQALTWRENLYDSPRVVYGSLQLDF